MKYPTLYSRQTSRQMEQEFRGYNHNLRIADGEFYDMRNMTSDHYPVLSPRGKRGVYAEPESPQGMISKDALCYIDGTKFVINGYEVDMHLSTLPDDCPKQLVSMGAYVIIMPDRKWINTLDLTQFGDIDARFDTYADVTFTLCRIDGTSYENAQALSSAPSNPIDQQLWIDTSQSPHVLKQYSTTDTAWITIAGTYIKIQSPLIGAAFEQYDGITISGVLDNSLGLNGSHIIWDRAENYIVVAGILDVNTEQEVEDAPITIERKMPEIDFITESENRLWGCRYGIAANGSVVNEIYASKLGDFKNWNCFMGLSTDSYAASCGTDGPFTGAITHLGYPLFFKENCVHKVFGNYPANFQIQTTACRGVQRGCENSMAILNEVLYYKSRSGVCAYDGSLPVHISEALGDIRYSNAAAGAHGNKYYISMQDVADNSHLFVYDAAKRMWHKEDDLAVDSFCAVDDELYAIGDGKIITMLGSGMQREGAVSWMVQTGQIGITSPDMKYVSRLTVRMSMNFGATVRFLVRYDCAEAWSLIHAAKGASMRSFDVPIRPKRCDHMELRIEGDGDVKIYSITKTIEQGSALS